MPLAKLTCPKCHATLKPAKPVPEGKTVKCPKCEEMFKAGGGAVQEKAAAPAKPAAAASEDDDEYGGGTYAVVKDEAEEKKKAREEERAKRKKKRKRAGDEDDEDEDDDEEKGDDLASELLRNLKQRDPRGPAQETIVSPANWLLRTALIGFFGWVFYFIVFMIPVAFPNRPEDPEKAKEEEALKERERAAQAPAGKADKGQSKEVAAKKKDKYRHWWSAETILKEENMPWSVVLFVFVLLLGLVQAGSLAIGSVKMQGLESYNWSVVGCVVAMVPLVTFPLFVFITSALDLFDNLLDAGWDDITWLMALVAFVWGPLVGGLCLKQVLQPQVKKGFEYRPD